ncbi:hypothetical protein EMWEY_00003710 [Eimeria maxima]|uniref:Uncharacterized protein n=1 Tax=Eimeria maxima TaxID=5804 RepID=U6M4K8_EIMMA|nr:hypothetical protein EMWEY_00003710 [Eimeria maxima]CDJ56595.1 hypothetical protein EMWEY_00003710 [Eimeria maxima]
MERGDGNGGESVSREYAGGETRGKICIEYTGVLCGVAPELHAIPVSRRWGKTLKRESQSAEAESADYEEVPQRTAVQPYAESIGDEVEGMQ